MTFVEFDSSGCIDPDWGTTRAEIANLEGGLFARRKALLAEPVDNFLHVPWRLHSAYQEHREQSELGQIFKTANGLHDQIDAVVVLGRTLESQALFQACCDPHHNELTRAARGSKPRIYFADCFDNDHVSALLNRIAIGGCGETLAEQRWALVVIDDGVQRAEFEAVFWSLLELLRSTLERTDGSEADELLANLLIPITRFDGLVRRTAGSVGCRAGFELPEKIDDRFLAMTPCSLLPAAMLGLDCMKLLGGAHEMTEHFRQAAFADNVALQFSAINRAMSEQGRVAEIKTWSSALRGIGRWNAHFTRPRSKTPASPTVIHNLTSTSHRWDLIRDVTSGKSLAEFENEAIQEYCERLGHLQRPSSVLKLHQADIFALGQLMQMLQIGAAIGDNAT